MPGRYAVLLERYIAVLPFWSTFGMVPGLINTFKFFLFSSPFDSFFFLPALPSIYLRVPSLSLRSFSSAPALYTLWRRLNRFFLSFHTAHSTSKTRLCEPVPKLALLNNPPTQLYTTSRPLTALLTSQKREKKNRPAAIVIQELLVGASHINFNLRPSRTTLGHPFQLPFVHWRAHTSSSISSISDPFL